MKPAGRNPCLLLMALLGCFTLAAAQQVRTGVKAITYEFVSPNTSEGLKLNDAIRKLNSAEEQRLISETRIVTCRISASPRINKSVGVWSDGAEHSTVVQIYADEAAARYAGASLGKLARQKAVLYFRRDPGGKARLYMMTVMSSPRKLAYVSRTLERAGISYRTLVPLKDRVIVYIVDLTNELRSQVPRATRLFRTHVQSFAGTGEFIGDDNDREKAQQVYADEISRYESTHKLRTDCATPK